MKDKKPSFSKKLKRNIKSQDSIAPSINNALHLGANSIQKTYLGGILAIMTALLMLYFIITQGLLMINRHQPNIQAVETPVDQANDN